MGHWRLSEVLQVQWIILAKILEISINCNVDILNHSLYNWTRKSRKSKNGKMKDEKILHIKWYELRFIPNPYHNCSKDLLSALWIWLTSTHLSVFFTPKNAWWTMNLSQYSCVSSFFAILISPNTDQ